MAKPRIARLNTLDAVILESDRIYRRCRHGEMDQAEGNTYSVMLQRIGSLINMKMTHDFDDRLKALEEKAGVR